MNDLVDRLREWCGYEPYESQMHADASEAADMLEQNRSALSHCQSRAFALAAECGALRTALERIVKCSPVGSVLEEIAETALNRDAPGASEGRAKD